MTTTWYTIAISVLTLLAVPTLFGLVWKDIYEHRKQMKKKNAEYAHQAEIDALRSIIKEEISPLDRKIDLIGEKLDKDNNGTLCTLRNDILNCYYNCLNKGYRNDFDYTNIHDLYDAYKALNGNSFVADIMLRFDALPTKEEYKREHAENVVKENVAIEPQIINKEGSANGHQDAVF